MASSRSRPGVRIPSSRGFGDGFRHIFSTDIHPPEEYVGHVAFPLLPKFYNASFHRPGDPSPPDSSKVSLLLLLHPSVHPSIPSPAVPLQLFCLTLCNGCVVGFTSACPSFSSPLILIHAQAQTYGASLRWNHLPDRGRRRAEEDDYGLAAQNLTSILNDPHEDGLLEELLETWLPLPELSLEIPSVLTDDAIGLSRVATHQRRMKVLLERFRADQREREVSAAGEQDSTRHPDPAAVLEVGMGSSAAVVFHIHSG